MQKPVICPACFAHDIDPVFLKVDTENGEHYCQKCTYVAKSREQAQAFLNHWIQDRYGINREGSF